MSEIRDSQELYLPKHCLIPLSVREDDRVPAEAKIFYGELEVLSNKHSYCWASNEALAKMKRKSVSTIERWLGILEKGGYLFRETSNKPYRDKNGRLLWKPDRKIYVGNDISKTNCETIKKEIPNASAKNEGFGEPPKNEGRNIQSLKYIKTTTSSSFSQDDEEKMTNILTGLRMVGINKITIEHSKKYTVQQIAIALHNTKLKENPDDISAYFFDQLKNSYEKKTEKVKEDHTLLKKIDDLRMYCDRIASSLFNLIKPSGFSFTVGEQAVIFKTEATSYQSIYFTDTTFFAKLETFFSECQFPEEIIGLCKSS